MVRIYKISQVNVWAVCVVTATLAIIESVHLPEAKSAQMTELIALTRAGH